MNFVDMISMILEKQKTIQKEFSIVGIGLHTGNPVNVYFKPADPNCGIIFIRIDLPARPVIKVCPENILMNSSMPRCSSIGKDDFAIYTVEHLMSVLAGAGIDNLIVEIDSNELPGLDGSGIGFWNAFKTAGILEQDSPKQYFDIKEPIGVGDNGSSIFIVPAQDFRISYTLDYNHPLLRSQFFSAKIDTDTFGKEIAPCRTFCLEQEAEELRKIGLGKGASYENTLVVGREGIKENQVRFKDEFARHKVLDFIGDIYLLGIPIRGHVFAVKSGHTLNMALLKKIYQQKMKYETKVTFSNYNFFDKKEIDIQGIMKILPHRYPFLLVDRVVELEKGKRAVGIKNVTANDSFFQGHFPTRPVMPGVLMIEAMAQTAGVAVLTNEEHHGKVAFFMAVDKVKFRKVVVPGDQLILDVRVVRDRARTAQIRAEAKVDGEIVAEADMMFSFTDASYLNI